MASTTYSIFTVDERMVDPDDPGGEVAEALIFLGQHDASGAREALRGFLKDHPMDGDQEFAVVPARNITNLRGHVETVTQLRIE
jgi:hypothetical protein